MLMKRLVAGAATAAIALSIGAAAHAQSTAGQAQEVIVTGTRTPPSANGIGVQVTDAKDESIVSKQFFETRSGSENLDQLINFLPGVSYTSEDPTGITSGDLRIHGFDGAHVAIILDGAPLNDTGNYASYPGEYVVSESIDHISVNMGSTDVDSPTASAVGGTVNIVTRTPPSEMGARLKVTGGSYGYGRVYGELDSGTFGPWGTKAYVGGEYVRADKWRGAGDLERWDVNGRIYQPLRGSDFLSLAANYTEESPIFYYSGSRAQLAQYGTNYDYNPTWAVPTVTPGKADFVATPAYAPYGNDAGFYALHPNPVHFATIRGQSKFTLGHGLTFTFDPNFFYTLANGGGATAINEFDKRLIGNATTTSANSHACIAGGKVTGVDLNGDGDCLDSVLLYSPSNTETYREGLTTSLLWDMNEHNHFQLAYTLDYGQHRQTAEFAPINQQTGEPFDNFGGKPGYAPQIATADLTTLRNRDRRSVAQLNQISGNYIGKFFDDRLHINIGGRFPYFERDLNQYCYTYNGSSQYCDSIATSSVQAALAADVAGTYNGKAESTAPSATAQNLTALLGTTVRYGATGGPNFRLPFSQTFHFDKFLPNAGASFRITDEQQVYISYAQGFSAPKTDDLYLSSTDLVKPETSTTYAAGYRYQRRWLNASVNLYRTDYNNRIVQSFDPLDPTLSIDRNVGSVQIQGVDFEAFIKPIEHLTLYSSIDFTDSKLNSNYQGASGPVPTQGKKLVLTPDHTFSLIATYEFGPITVGADAKYTSSRYISDVNDDRIAPFAVFDVNAKYNLPYFNNHSYFQLNITNLFNRTYISRSSTVASTYGYTVPGAGTTVGGSTPFLYVAGPSMFQLTFNAQY